MEHNIDQPLTLAVEQAAKILGIGRSTAYELVHTGDIPSLRLGRRIVVPVGRIAEWLGIEPSDVQQFIEPTRHPMSTRPESGSQPYDPSEVPALF